MAKDFRLTGVSLSKLKTILSKIKGRGVIFMDYSTGHLILKRNGNNIGWIDGSGYHEYKKSLISQFVTSTSRIKSKLDKD